jgi:hypothetical protein
VCSSDLVDADGVDDLLLAVPDRLRGAGGAWVVDPTELRYGPVADFGVLIAGDLGSSLLMGIRSALGDVTGDGVVDVILYGADMGEGVRVFAGPVTEGLVSADATTRLRDDRYWDFGLGLTVGDLTGDGVDDLVVGNPQISGVAVDVGMAFIFEGPLAEGESEPSAAAFDRVRGEVAGAGFGANVLTGGDVDGDGVDDLLITACYGPGSDPASGLVHLFLGPWTVGTYSGDHDANLKGETTDAATGMALAFGDLDGDGVDDVVVGAPGNTFDRVRGAVYVVSRPSGAVSLSEADVEIKGGGGFAELGGALAVADADGDGGADLLIGGPSAREQGAAFLYWEIGRAHV